MNPLKRALLSITRRPGKSLILFLVVFIIGNLIAGTVAVQQAITQTESLAKASMGATVSLGIDDQKIMQAYSQGEEVTIESPSANVIEQLGQRPEVRSFDYSLTVYLGSKTLKNWEQNGTMGGITVMRVEAVSGGSGESDILGNFQLRGTRYAPIMAIEEGKLRLVSGRTFTQDEITRGALVCLIPDVVAEVNNVHVGDTVSFTNEIVDYSVEAYTTSPTEKQIAPSSQTNVIASHDVVLEVIGIFSMNSGAESAIAKNDSQSSTFSVNPGFDFSYEFNQTVYLPIKIAQEEDRFMVEGYEKLYQRSDPSYTIMDYSPYYTPLYILKSIDDLDSFTEAANQALPMYYTVLSAKSQYEQVAGPMKDIQGIINIALVVVIVAALVIISLVVVLFLRDRRKEFGIYLSLGERKPAVVSQVVVEVLVVAVVALAIAIFTGNLISGNLSQSLVDSQLSTTNNPYGGYSGIYYGGEQGLLMGSISLEDVVASYHVGFDLSYVLMFLGVGLGTVALSCVVPLLYIVRLQPKKILM